MSILKITSLGLLMGLMSGCVSAYDYSDNYRGGRSYSGSISPRYYAPSRRDYRDYRNDYQRQTSPTVERIRPSDAGVSRGYGDGGNSYSGSINSSGGNSYN